MSPFVVEDVRAKIRELGFGESDAVGDLCFIVYSEMMKRWNASPRWTTIHYLKKEFVRNQDTSDFLQRLLVDLAYVTKLGLPGFCNTTSTSVAGVTITNAVPVAVAYKFDKEDVYTASELAFDVFMHFHGIEYEKKKRDENGDIL